MTVAARNLDVFAGQREVGLAVVEPGMLPIGLGMAVGAVWTESAAVFVVLLVAGHAFRRCCAKLLAGRVTVAAGDLGARVPATQREIGLAVIERSSVERRDIHVAPLMLGMTAPAILVAQASVKPAMCLHVAGHVLVAVEAQTGLRGPVEAHVALGAVGVELGVTDDELSRR